LLTERLRERQQRKKDKASDSLQALGVESPPLMDHRRKGSGSWVLVSGCWLLVAGCWLRVTCYLLLVAGYWLLVAGCGLWVAGLSMP